MQASRQEAWLPRIDSWEEAVLSWQEQIERVFERVPRGQRKGPFRDLQDPPPEERSTSLHLPDA